jgi:hypothetical protein
MVRVSGYRSRSPGLERGPLSLMSTIEELLETRGHAVALRLRHYATSRKVAGSIPDEGKF